MESKRTRALCKLWRERRGMLSYPLIGGAWTPKGWPDRLFIHPMFGAALVEFKEDHAELRPDQRMVAAEIIAAGGRYLLARLFSGVDAIQLELGSKQLRLSDVLLMPEHITLAIGEWYSAK